MLLYANWKQLTILALIGVVWLPGACPASGQEYGAENGLEYTSPGDFYLSGAAGSASAEDAAKPTAPLPAPTKPKPPGVDDTRPTPPARQPARQPATRRTLASRGQSRLASLPNMFGDISGQQTQVGPSWAWGWSSPGWEPDESFWESYSESVMSIPSPGGARSVKISENDKALPMDRVFFSYNHFHNALDGYVPNVGTRSFPIDQYTVGVEKTFFDELWSVELRLPFSRTPQVMSTDLAADTGDVGNLAIVLKRLLYATDTTAVAVGLPIGTPTGSDITGQGLASSFSLSNDAVHLAPFIGFLNSPNDRVFHQGFLQLDVPTRGNRVTYGGNDLGRLDEQTLLYLDYCVGYWLYRNPCSPCVTGLAGVLEYHYTTTLNDADLVGGTDGNQFLQFGNAYNRQDISNLTLGVHAEFGLTTVRLGGVVPLGGKPNRLYDAEFQLSVNRKF